MLLWLLACASETGPAPSGSRSAELALRAGEVGRRADALAERTRELEGLFDQLRATPPGEREAIRARVQEVAAELKTEAVALQDEVEGIEADARVWE